MAPSNKKTENNAEKKEAKKVAAASAGPSGISRNVLIEPWVTEKSHDKISENKYIFKIAKDANKKSAKRAVEEIYKVKVISVNIVNISPKKRNYGAKRGWKSGYKKAIVTLKEGDKIELFKGV